MFLNGSLNIQERNRNGKRRNKASEGYRAYFGFHSGSAGSFRRPVGLRFRFRRFSAGAYLPGGNYRWEENLSVLQGGIPGISKDSRFCGIRIGGGNIYRNQPEYGSLAVWNYESEYWDSPGGFCGGSVWNRTGNVSCAAENGLQNLLYPSDPLWCIWKCQWDY